MFPRLTRSHVFPCFAPGSVFPALVIGHNFSTHGNESIPGFFFCAEHALVCVTDLFLKKDIEQHIHVVLILFLFSEIILGINPSIAVVD